MALLPPKVLGPVTERSAFVTVVGAVEGAVVQLLANGEAVGVPTAASGLSVNVPLGDTRLTPGASVTATQARGHVGRCHAARTEQANRRTKSCLTGRS